MVRRAYLNPEKNELDLTLFHQQSEGLDPAEGLSAGQARTCMLCQGANQYVERTLLPGDESIY